MRYESELSYAACTSLLCRPRAVSKTIIYFRRTSEHMFTVTASRSRSIGIGVREPVGGRAPQRPQRRQVGLHEALAAVGQTQRRRQRAHARRDGGEVLARHPREEVVLNLVLEASVEPRRQVPLPVLAAAENAGSQRAWVGIVRECASGSGTPFGDAQSRWHRSPRNRMPQHHRPSRARITTHAAAWCARCHAPCRCRSTRSCCASAAARTRAWRWTLGGCPLPGRSGSG